MGIRWRTTVVLALWLSGSASVAKQRTGSTAAPALHDLKSFAELRERFNNDRGKLRIVLLLSPT